MYVFFIGKHLTGEPLVQGKDDNAETLKNRLKAFHAQTKPVRKTMTSCGCASLAPVRTFGSRGKHVSGTLQKFEPGMYFGRMYGGVLVAACEGRATGAAQR
jgi:hypothetical protein